MRRLRRYTAAVVIAAAVAVISAGAVLAIADNPSAGVRSLVNAYIAPGRVIGFVFLEAIGSSQRIIPEESTTNPLRPATLVAATYWAIVVAIIYARRSPTVAFRLFLGTLSTLWLTWSASQLTQAGGGIGAIDGAPFPFRSLREDYYYITPVALFGFLLIYCLPEVTPRIGGSAMVAILVVALWPLAKAYQIGNIDRADAASLVAIVALVIALRRAIARESGANIRR